MLIWSKPLLMLRGSDRVQPVAPEPGHHGQSRAGIFTRAFVTGDTSVQQGLQHLRGRCELPESVGGHHESIRLGIHGSL